ncbi:tubulin-specific chaperone A [Cimex lectularius]|uniref:Tubulin-specific chaperone A n=1 Tax=Cimex lectularius TaxID=79782 RepID=D1FPP3_CIMLE|nr:tubulin-specific chaperone A [Cimex lectularius]
MADPRLKKIKVQTGVVKRLAREKVSYEQEVDSHKAKIEQFKKEGKDEAVVNKQIEILNETIPMIADTQRRLKKAFTEFEALLEAEKDLKATEEYAAGLKALEDAKPHLPS